MFERFDEDALKAFLAAQGSARELQHREIGTAHLLVGLVSEEWYLSAQVLAWLGTSSSDVRTAVAAVLPPGHGEASSGHVPLDATMMGTVRSSTKEAGRLRDDRVGTQHLLLALLRDGKSIGARVLTGMGIDHQRATQALEELRSQT